MTDRVQHEFVFTAEMGGREWAMCSCGWAGPDVIGEDTARADWENHAGRPSSNVEAKCQCGAYDRPCTPEECHHQQIADAALEGQFGRAIPNREVEASDTVTNPETGATYTIEETHTTRNSAAELEKLRSLLWELWRRGYVELDDLRECGFHETANAIEKAARGA